MFYNDDDKIKNKKKPGFNSQAFKHAIGMIESSGGKYLSSTSSSAAGKYHFLWNLIKDDDSLEGMSKSEFIANKGLQESLMDRALEGKLSGYPNYIKYANSLKERYNSNLRPTQIAALTHFLGAGNVKKYLSNPSEFKVKGINLSPEEYIEKYNEYSDKYKYDNPSEDSYVNKVNEVEEKIDFKERLVNQTIQPKDNTDVSRRFEMPSEDNFAAPTDGVSLPTDVEFVMPDALSLLESTYLDTGSPEENIVQVPNQEQPDNQLEPNNEFREGGQTNYGQASDLVTVFEGGGTHEENPLGGIPQGQGSNGKVNLVEEGETKWNDYIFSNAYDMDGNFTSKEGKKSNVFKDGGELNSTDPKDPDPDPVKSSSVLTQLARNLLPLPNNASQMLAAIGTSDGTYSTKDASKRSNDHLYRSVRNAIKRTGKKDGGTEYSDYSQSIAKDLNSLKGNAADIGIGSFISPELDAATTFGRVSYRTDPKTGLVNIYDSYDFSKTPGGGGAYQTVRNLAGKASQGRLKEKPVLIGSFDPNKKDSFLDNLGGFVDDLRNPIKSLDVRYGDIKETTGALSRAVKGAVNTGANMLQKGVDTLSNMFEEGGSLTDPKPLRKNYKDDKAYSAAYSKYNKDLLSSTATSRKDNIPNKKFNLKKSGNKVTEKEQTRQIQQAEFDKMQSNQMEMKEYVPQSFLSKSADVALNPLTALGYLAKNKDIPDNFTLGERNPLDYATDLLNPAQYVNDANNLVQGTATGNLSQIGEGLLGAVPFALEGKNLVKGVKKRSNVYDALTQSEAVESRGKRMLSQEDKWQGQNNTELRNKFENASKNHNSASDLPGSKLGVNRGSSTEVSKYADLSDANKSRIAAHEAGHYYKPTRAEGDEWNSFFDWSKMKGNKAGSTARDNRMTKEYLSGKGYTKHRSTQYGDEIRERAAQIKDYIAQKRGVGLDKDFTISKKDFDYALKNYSKETGLDNSMTSFISAIKDKNGLLKMMNKSALGVAPLAGAAYLNNNEATNSFAEGGSLTDPDPPLVKKTSNKNNLMSFLDNPLTQGLNEKETDRFYVEKPDRPNPTRTDRLPVEKQRDKYLKYDSLALQNPSSTGVDFQSLVTSEASQEFLNWNNNPTTRQRLMSQGNLTSDQVDDMIIKGLKAKKEVKVPGDSHDNLPDGSSAESVSYNRKNHPDTMHMPKYVEGKGMVRTHGLGDDRVRYNLESQDDVSVGVHERTHASTIDSAMSKATVDVLGSAFKQDKGQTSRVKGYMIQPTETYSNFVEMRNKLGMKPGEQIDEKTLINKMKVIESKSGYKDHFYNTYDNDKIIKALNTLAYQDQENSDNYTLS